MARQTVAVIFGSRSAEHDVSIVTALSAVIKPLELSKKYNVVPIYIAKDGRWFSDDKLKNISLYSSGKIEDFVAKSKPIAIQFDGRMTLLKPGVKNKKIKVDVVFPATHGTYGEDGTLMGVCEMANVPYVGCDVESSAIAMDKVATKMIAKGIGLLTVPDVIFDKQDYEADSDKWIKKIEKELGYPAFVKPPHLGSSIGVTKVDNREELKNAIEVALVYDWRVLVEQAVPNLREATLPIMGLDDEVVPAYLEEPLFASEEFFDFDTKYMNQGKGGGKKTGAKQGAQGYSRIPADFDKELYESVESTALEAYKAVGCNGLARVDILIDAKKRTVYFNEINPLPGSLYAHNWRAKGVSNIELVEALIYFAKKRYEKVAKLTTTFSTNFLKQF